MSNVWQELNHDSIFNSVENTLGAKLNSLLRHRNSYINRVYELERKDNKERFIAKFYRPGRWTKEMILEEHRFLNELNKKDIPAIEPLTFKNSTLHSLGNIHYTLFPKKGGRAIDEFNQESWENIGRHLARIHTAGSLHKKPLRITWRPKTATKHHLDLLHRTEFILPDFRKSFNTTAEEFIKKADPMFEGTEMFLIHGDCHKGNLIHRPNEGIWIIDFDDICVGPPVQDLWMLLPGHIDDHMEEFGWFLKGYGTFREFDIRSLKLIPALRGMRIIHFISWLAVQSKDPHFHRHFPDTGTPRYWNETIKELQNILYNEL
ncbi:serine/threonine protein kinase [Candidatus Margulisiibacteriota bacterium]